MSDDAVVENPAPLTEEERARLDELRSRESLGPRLQQEHDELAARAAVVQGAEMPEHVPHFIAIAEEIAAALGHIANVLPNEGPLPAIVTRIRGGVAAIRAIFNPPPPSPEPEAETEALDGEPKPVNP